MAIKIKPIYIWPGIHIIGIISMIALRYLSGSFVMAAQSGETFKIRMEVELATVQVSVQDKRGSAIHNLHKDDFELYEDGKKQEILSVDEVNVEDIQPFSNVNPIEETPQYGGKTVFIVFDDSAGPLSRDSALKLVKNYMRPQDIFAIASYKTSMNILQKFTADKKEILKAIEYDVTAEGHNSALSSGNLYQTLEAIIPSIAPIKGQKSIILYFSQDPAEKALVGSEADAATEGKALVNLKRVASAYQSFIASERSLLLAARKANVVFYASCENSFCYSSLASNSGGFSLRNALGGDDDLKKLDQQLSNYYILGFHSDQFKNDKKFRKIEAKVKIKGSTVKYPKGYQDRRPLDILKNTDQEKTLLAAMAYPVPAGMTPVLFRSIYFHDTPQIARVLISALIPREYPEYKNTNKAGRDLNIMGAAYAENGSIAARFSDTLPVSSYEGKESEIGKRALFYRNYFRLRPGAYRVKLAVSNGTNILSSVEKNIEIPIYPDKGLTASSLVVVQQASQMPELIQNIKDQLLDEADPLIYLGNRIEPSVTNRISIGSAIPVLFRLYNLPPSSDSWHLTAKTKLLGENGEIYQGETYSLKDSIFWEGKTKAILSLMLSFPKAPAGKYRLVLEIGQSGLTEATMLETDLELMTP
jgi:VWFA-related protein